MCSVSVVIVYVWLSLKFNNMYIAVVKISCKCNLLRDLPVDKGFVLFGRSSVVFIADSRLRGNKGVDFLYLMYNMVSL